MQAAKKEDMSDIERQKYYDLGKKVTVNVSIPKIKRQADKDKILALGNAIAEACGYDYGILATYFISTDDIMK